ncbi:SH3 domain-containing protein [Faucicola atlantae]|uniref:SH3 domain-containing protein n=1 Tax=Faucicola atlantae TaxID=34059 RepID=UPI0009F70FC6|nr:SH3 domain-containing protein [Moraxella atlantae]
MKKIEAATIQTITKAIRAMTLLAAVVLIQTPAHALGPAGRVNSGYACTNSGSNLILRAGPGQQFAKLNGIRYGTSLPILNSATGRDGMLWYKVRFGKRVGWVRYDYVCGL